LSLLFAIVIPSEARNLLLRRDKSYYVYIMASKGRVLYFGVTGFLHSRVLQHKSGEFEGFTKGYNITRLVYCECFQYVKTAVARETEIKKWNRAKKIALIERVNPIWEDLAADWGKPHSEQQIPRFTTPANQKAGWLGTPVRSE